MVIRQTSVYCCQGNRHQKYGSNIIPLSKSIRLTPGKPIVTDTCRRNFAAKLKQTTKKLKVVNILKDTWFL